MCATAATELPPVTMTTLLFSPTMIFRLKMLIWFEYAASQERLSILIAGSWKRTGINLRKFLRRLASLFFHSQCQLALEIETLRKYTILVILYKLDHKSVCQLTIKDITELKRAAGSKLYEDENEIR